MTNDDLTFLEAICSSCWENILVGGLDSNGEGPATVSANHVFVSCETPFLVSATSLDLASGEEIFGLALIRQTETIEEFLRGPYYPHNVPRSKLLRDIFGTGADQLLADRKLPTFLRRTYKSFSEPPQLLTLVSEVIFSVPRFSLKIEADVDIPMGLRLSC